MSSDDNAVRVHGLGKCYHIYTRPQDRLKQSIVPRLQRLAGRQPANYFREFWALRDVSFEVQRGETIGIIGPNGSGKSTLLQILCGTITPTTGEVETRGRVAAMLELGAGFNPEFTGRENVYLNGSLLGLTEDQVKIRFDDIAAFADIGEFVEQPVKTYSSGMFMRLAFAVIAHVDADILVIDEALAVGDAFFVQKCMRFLRDFQRKGTILFVSHDTSTVTNLCERAIWLDHGQVMSAGRAKDVCEQYFSALYEKQQGAGGVRQTPVPKVDAAAELIDKQNEPGKDSPEAIQTSGAGQIIKMFGFNADSASFGSAQATIVSVQLVDTGKREPLSWILGGEEVEIIVQAACHVDLDSPIIGFIVKDRLGQSLIGDNTYREYRHNPLFSKAGSTLEARFRFNLPLLLSGDYSICAAIASGTMESHVQHHWLHDAMIFRVQSSLSGVLVGVPMKSIAMIQIT